MIHNIGDLSKVSKTISGLKFIDTIEKYKPVRLPQRPEKVKLVEHYVDGKGQKRIKGSKQLKAWQSYPIGPLGSVCLFLPI